MCPRVISGPTSGPPTKPTFVARALRAGRDFRDPFRRMLRATEEK